MTTDTFAITPPSQEEVEQHASLEGYTVTPSERYKGALGLVERVTNDSDTWVAVGIHVTLLSTVEGAEEVNSVAIGGRDESTNVSTELFQRESDGEGGWMAIIGDDGEPVRRTDDGAQTAYRMGYKTFAQLFQAIGALPSGETDLSTLGFVTEIGLFDADAIVTALSGYEGTEVGVQVRNQAQRRKNSAGKKVAVRGDDGKVRREAVITDFFTL